MAAARESQLFDSSPVPPKKVAWLQPWQLARTGYHAFLSRVATEFLDRREILAALDRTVLRVRGGSVLRPIRLGRFGQTRALKRSAALRDNEDIWIDFVADIGDSWEATYSTALLMARSALDVSGNGEKPLPRADIVVFGGDLVYPHPTRTRYRTRLRSAFISALPDSPSPRNGRLRPCLLAIPGNHDWYDGLMNFVRVFCQGGPLGGWTLVQTRSYFAAKVARGWWIWGIDIALDTRIDAPQQRYFLDVLEAFEKGDRIILCTAKPVWLDDPRHSVQAYKNLAYFVNGIIKKRGRVPVVLAGDLHHYNRFENEDREQLIVSGGGGAYLVGTHDLPEQVAGLDSVDGDDHPVDTDEAHRLRGPFRAAKFPYPSRAESRRLALGALWLLFRPANWPFALSAGLIAWLIAWPVRQQAANVFTGPASAVPRGVWRLVTRDLSLRGLALALTIVIGCGAFAVVVNRRPRFWLALWGTAHGATQIVLPLALARFFADHAVLWRMMHRWTARLPWAPDGLASFALGLLFIMSSGAIAAVVVGVYLVLSNRLFAWHRDAVFAVQSIIDYRSFLRMRIDTNGTLSIYPIGLRRVPRQWRSRAPATTRAVPTPEEKTPAQVETEPLFQPGDATLDPHLIEAPIRIM